MFAPMIMSLVDLVEQSKSEGVIHGAAVLFGGSLRIKKLTRQRQFYSEVPSE